MNENEVIDFLDFPGADRLIAAGEVAPPDAAVVAAALEAVRSARAEDERDDTGHGRGTVPPAALSPGLDRTPRRRGRRVLLSLVLAAVVAGAVAVPTIPFGGAPPVAGADAATFLREVAGTAADARTTDAPYWKVRRTMTGAGGTTTTGTVWVGRSGIVSRASNGKYTLFPPGGEAGGQMVWPVAGLEVDWDELRELPTEPRALKAFLHSGTPDAPEQEAVFNGIVSLLSAPVSPELRAALYDVLAGLPYLRLVGPVHDRAGRAGVAIEYDGEDVRSRVVIDPESALPLEESNTTLGGPEDGDLVSSVTYLSLRAVRNAPEAVPVEPHSRADVERLRTVPFREK